MSGHFSGNIPDSRRAYRRRLARERRKAARAAGRGRKGTWASARSQSILGWYLGYRPRGTDRSKERLEKIREELNDKAYKAAPGLQLINEQHRLRESKRCGRMKV